MTTESDGGFIYTNTKRRRTTSDNRVKSSVLTTPVDKELNTFTSPTLINSSPISSVTISNNNSSNNNNIPELNTSKDPSETDTFVDINCPIVDLPIEQYSYSMSSLKSSIKPPQRPTLKLIEKTEHGEVRHSVDPLHKPVLQIQKRKYTPSNNNNLPAPLPPPPPIPDIQYEKVILLENMGFEKPLIHRALKRTQGNIQAAILLLLTNTKIPNPKKKSSNRSSKRPKRKSQDELNSPNTQDQTQNVSEFPFDLDLNIEIKVGKGGVTQDHEEDSNNKQETPKGKRAAKELAFTRLKYDMDYEEDIADDSEDAYVDDAQTKNDDNSNTIDELEKLIQSCEGNARRLRNLIMKSNIKDEIIKYNKEMRTEIKEETVDDNNPGQEEKDTVTLESQPNSISKMCKLTGYQVIGLNWLYILHQENLNGILADEMGLGKTIQVIALLTLLKEKKLYSEPSLIVVPASALAQWGNEIRKWSPTLQYEIYTGSLLERIDLQKNLVTKKKIGEVNEYGYDILLTSYHMLGSKYDRNFLKKMNFHYLVLDEAHNIKNQNTLRYQTLYKVTAKRRLLLTGTPLQNNLEELWSLLIFLMPKEFSTITLKNYKEVFKDSIEKRSKKIKVSDKSEYIRRIKTILASFILRRLKRHASIEIPKKVVRIKNCDMAYQQRTLYDKIFQYSKSILDRESIQSHKPRSRKYHSDDEVDDISDLLYSNSVLNHNEPVAMHSFLNNILMQLRKSCNHPILLRNYFTEDIVLEVAQILKKIDPEYRQYPIKKINKELLTLSDWKLHNICKYWDDLKEFRLNDEQIYSSSAKMVVLKKLLHKLHTDRKRILLFSQMTKMLDILEPFIEKLGYSYLRLDGKTKVIARQGLIDKFNESPNIFIFLLSTRAGGLGINLTSADTVIFYDICFNPHVDRQAEDRCHRLGQTKQVQVFKLIIRDSCEEHIYERAEQKKELNDIILQEGNYQITTPSSRDLSKFLGDLFNQKKKKKSKSKSKKLLRSKSTSDIKHSKPKKSPKLKKSKSQKKKKKSKQHYDSPSGSDWSKEFKNSKIKKKIDFEKKNSQYKKIQNKY